MRVIQLLSNLNTAGPQCGALELSRALIKAGHESHVVAADGDLKAAFMRSKAIIHPFKLSPGSIKILWQLRQLKVLIHNIKPDIIHVREPGCAWALKLVIKSMQPSDRPIVIGTMHQVLQPNYRSRALVSGDALICVSQHVYAYVQSHFEVENQKLYCIPRGIDPKIHPYRYQPSIHWWNTILAEYPQLDSKVWLTVPGKLHFDTGHQWILDVIGGLKAEFPHIHAVFIGEPRRERSNYVDELKMRIGALDLEENVTFTGNRSDLRDWLAASHLVLELSNKDKGSGRNVLSALFMGTPVLAWDRGGIHEIMSDLFPEGLIEPNNCLQLCQKVREQIISKSRPAKPRTYQLEGMTDQCLQIYKDLIKKRTE